MLLTTALVVSGLALDNSSVLTVNAEEIPSKPLSVTAFATPKQLVSSDNFALHTAYRGAAQKVYFGKNGEKQQTWYIAGSDADDSIVLLCDLALPMAMSQKFNNSTDNGTYDGATVYANHYGASDLRKLLQSYTADGTNDRFSNAEKQLMQSTKVYTDVKREDGSTESTYYTEDVLYPAYGDFNDDKYITVGANSADRLNGGLKVSLTDGVYASGDIFWLRAPYYDSSNYALVANPGYYVNISRVNIVRSVVPAFRLNLSSVLFASAAPAATSSASLTDTMTFRVNGSQPDNAKITSQAYYSTDNVIVDAAEDETVYLYVQGNDGTKDWVYSQEVSTDGTIEANTIMSGAKDSNGNAGSLTSVDLSQCKIWIEKKVTDDNLVYAVMAKKIETVTTVEVTDITAPEAGAELDVDATCITPGVSTKAPTVSYTKNGEQVSGNAAGWTSYIATVELEAAGGYTFTDETTATINGEAASVSYDATTGKLTVSYTFKTAKLPLGNTYYVTKDELMSSFDLDGTNDTVGKVYFGTSGENPLQWYIAGKDSAQETDNIVLFSAQSLGSCQFGVNSTYAGSTLEATIKGYEYVENSSTSKFTDAEDSLMLFTSLASNPPNDGTAKLYALNPQGFRVKYITAGANDDIRIALSYWGSDEFWLRAPHCSENDDALVADPGFYVSLSGVNHVNSVVPAFNLNLSSVLFASAAPAATSDASLEIDETYPVYSFRLDGTEKIKSKAAYTTGGVTVNYDEGDGNVFLYVQDADSVYSVEITKDTTVALSDMTGIESLTDGNIKIWLEKSEDNVAYAVMAEEADVTHVEAKEATSEAAGNEEYWYFKIGEDIYYFSDEGCSVSIECVTKKGHKWSYSLRGETTIVATCFNGCQKSPVTFTLTASENAVYDGSEHKATVTVSAEGVLEVPTISYNTIPINAGEVTASIVMGEGEDKVTAKVTYEIEKATPDIGTVSANELTNTTNVEDVELSYTNKAVSGTLELTDSELKYGTNTYNWKFIPTGEDAVNYKETTGPVEITVNDTIAPTIQYQIGTNGLKEFTNKITFGLFCDDYKTITIEYTDNDKVAAKQYYISNEKITDTSNINWSDYTEPISIDEKGTYYIYAKATDNSSNATQVLWDEYVLYEESTLDSESIAYTYKENKDCSVQVALNGNTFAKLTSADGANENEIATENYTMDKDEKLTLKATYLDTLKKGDYTYKIYMKPQGVETTEVALAYTFTVKVKERELSVTEATAKNKDYDGSANVEITGITLDNVATGDDVSVKLDGVQGTLKGADAGDYTLVTLSELSLQGEDAGNYTLVQPTEAVSTNVTIHKLNPAITVGTDSYVKTYGDAAFTLDVTDTNEEASVRYEVTEGEDVVSVSNNTVTILKAGSATITVSLLESTNYNAESKTITVNVTPATPFVATPPSASAITYGDTLSISELTSGVVHYSNTDSTGVSGSFAWKDGSIKPFVSDSNSTTYTVVFTPADTTNYNTVETAIKLTVNKAENAPKMPDSTISVSYSNTTVGAVTLPDGWVWQDTDKTKALEVGKALEATAVYTGTDKGNYEKETVVITITRSDCEHLESDILYTGDGEKEPTCTEAGIGHTECTKCKESIRTNVSVEATGHNGGIATCKDKAECTTCHEFYGELDKNNHVGETEVKNAKEATCGAEGYTGDTYCKACGTKKAEGAKIDKLTTHTWDAGVVTKEATTTEMGEKTYTCSVCNTTKTEEIPVKSDSGTPGTKPDTPGANECEHEESDIFYTGNGEKAPTCTEAGIGHTECTKCNEVMQSNVAVEATGHIGGIATCKDKAECTTCHEFYGELDKNNHVGETEVKNAKEATCGAEGYTGDTYCKACGTKTADGTKNDKLTTHTWDAGVVTKEATTTEKGEKTYTCSICKTTRVEEIPVVATKPGDNTQTGDNTKPGDNTQTGDNTAPTGYDTAEETEKTIIFANTDKGDVKGSTFAALQLKAVGNNKAVKLTWKKVKDADGYILYAAQCDKKLKKLETFTGASVVKYTHKKLKKATFYKYMVVAYKKIDGKQYTIATSKTVHAVTNGGKYANPTNVTVKASKLSIKKGAKKTIKASLKLPKNKKLKVHIAKFRYESDNTQVATVTSKGVVKGKKKGTANIYVYTQNGVYKKVKVTVK